MKKRYLVLSLVFWGFIFMSVSGFCAEYEVSVNFMSRDFNRPVKVYNFFIDFGREINPASLKLFPEDNPGKTLPIYFIPLAKYKARICFITEKDLPRDSDVIYKLRFSDGKWSDTPCGDDKVKKEHKEPVNLVQNGSFEEIFKSDQYHTWRGDYCPKGWQLWDCASEYWMLPNRKSMCRVSDEVALQGKRSLMIVNETPRDIKDKNSDETIILSGSANTSYLIKIKPDTGYIVKFFLKIVQHYDNKRNFQSVNASAVMLDAGKNSISSGGVIQAAYSVAFIPEESYLNTWLEVQGYDVSPENAAYAQITIGGKFSGKAYVDVVEFYETEKCQPPDISIISQISEVKPAKPQK
ncbi:MAG: hypothetical protein WC071_11610 [Victivallaceae bacterium]